MARAIEACEAAWNLWRALFSDMQLSHLASFRSIRSHPKGPARDEDLDFSVVLYHYV